MKDYQFLQVSQPTDHVIHVQLNRPAKRNALNAVLWREIGDCFRELDDDENCRVIILSGAGKVFCSGIDLFDGSLLETVSNDADDLDAARKGRRLAKHIAKMQQHFTSIEECSKPVIAAVHGGAYGAGLDIISCCDIRMASQDTKLSIKEVDIGIVADVGSLQRFVKSTGNQSWLRDISMTARIFDAEEALRFGILSTVLPTYELLMKHALQLAKVISDKSPVATQGTKLMLNYAQDHSIKESLNHVLTWNMSQLQTDDIMKSVQATQTKEKALFSKL